jgi:crossover junction endodeoxyribonuclease RusA
MTYTLPEPPSSNRYWRVFRGIPVMSAEARAYKNKVALMLRGKMKIAKGDISVTLAWYRGRKSGDLDNRAKVALDALQGSLYLNDSQIVALHLYRYDDKANPRIEVSVQDA